MQENNAPIQERTWIAVPVYNNRDTVRAVVEECRALMPNVLVVDDGSTDGDVSSVLAGLVVAVVKHPVNSGKGRAILTASRYVEERGGEYMITIDADGQHLPRDAARFLPLLDDAHPAIIIGSRDFNTAHVPPSSRFGRSFANFWLRVETGRIVDDCQSGFRAYPVRYLNRMTFKGERYDFEAEVLAKAVWAGLEIKTVPIEVRYPKPEERVTSFKPVLDNLRLTAIHSMLVGRRLLPWPHRKLVKDGSAFTPSLLRHPWKVVRTLIMEQATPEGLAMSAAVGMFLAVLPLLFVHSLVILYVALRLNLNKIVALNVQHLAVPPFIPALCIEVGFYLRHGEWLTNLSFKTVFEQFGSRLYEWFLGSLIIAPLSAIVVGGVMFVVASVVKRIKDGNVAKEGC